MKGLRITGNAGGQSGTITSTNETVGLGTTRLTLTEPAGMATPQLFHERFYEADGGEAFRVCIREV